MGFIKVVLVTSTLMVLLAFYARPPYPDTATNQTQKAIVGLYVKLIGLVSYYGSYLGFSPVNITRVMFDANQLLDKKSDQVEETSITIDGVEALMFRPKDLAGTSNRGLVYLHGGGWQLLNPASYAPLSRQMALAMQAVTIAPNYRKAPEHVFPAAFDDCMRVTKYFLEHADEFGVDPYRISISGDSAGGNLAMATSLNLLDDKSLPPIQAIGMIYPAIQALDMALPSYQKYENGPGFLNKQVMINFWLRYAFGDLRYYDLFYNNSHVSDSIRQSKLKDFVSRNMLPEQIKADGDLNAWTLDKELGQAQVPDEIAAIITNPNYTPLMASDSDIAKLPPTYVLTAEFDVLRDEGYLLVERLKKNNVDVKHLHLPGEEHACLFFVDYDPNMIDVVKDIAGFISK